MLLEFFATVFVLLQLWFYGKNVKLGGIFGGIAAILWILIGFKTSLLSLVIVNILIFIISVRNVIIPITK